MLEPKSNLKPKKGPKNPKVKLGQKNVTVIILFIRGSNQLLLLIDCNAIIIIVLMLKQKRHSVLQIYFNYAFIAPKMLRPVA